MLKFLRLTVFTVSVLLTDTAFSAKQYAILKQPVSNASDITLFFSFYCPPCYLFSDHYNVLAGINRLQPPVKSVSKYHISNMGKLGRELSEAWAVANVTGVTDSVEKLMFAAMQQHHAVNTKDDIYKVFDEAGISRETYNSASQSVMVRAFIARQDEMASALKVTGTPSVYVKGKYLIDNSKIKADSPEAYVTAYARLVSDLLNK